VAPTPVTPGGEEKKTKKHKKSKTSTPEKVEVAPTPVSTPGGEEKKSKKKKSKTPSTPVESSSSASSSSLATLSSAERKQGLDRYPNGLSVIANPLATGKLHKKCLKLVKKAAAEKKVRRGVREAIKAIRKNERGLMVIAGNISPIDVITHVPVLCEEKDIPYIYVTAKEELGLAALTKRSTSCILITTPAENASYKAYYEEVKANIIQVTPTMW